MPRLGQGSVRSRATPFRLAIRWEGVPTPGIYHAARMATRALSRRWRATSIRSRLWKCVKNIPRIVSLPRAGRSNWHRSIDDQTDGCTVEQAPRTEIGGVSRENEDSILSSRHRCTDRFRNLRDPSWGLFRSDGLLEDVVAANPFGVMNLATPRFDGARQAARAEAATADDPANRPRDCLFTY